MRKISNDDEVTETIPYFESSKSDGIISNSRNNFRTIEPKYIDYKNIIL